MGVVIMENGPQWGTRVGFILAAIGSAVGLGNIWRFPAVAFENGGGAFFIPYLFALITAGVPLLILEFTMGQKYRGSAPLTFARMNKKTEWIGWWQLAISFVISTYYVVIVAWALSYSFFSLKQSWGKDTEGFLVNDYLKLTVDAGQTGSIVPGVFIPLIMVWIIVLGILVKGIKKGIESANKIFLPILVVLFSIIVIRAVTLPGATTGLNAFFEPNWDKILDGSVWIAAYGQIFFSLSVGFAIMMTYASYLPKKGDITNNAFITAFANSSFELLAGIGVFSILGFMAVQQGVDVKDVVAGGVGLAFVVFPSIINELPAFNGFFGFLFFASLFLAGLTSLISILETFVAGIQDKFKLKRTLAVLLGGGLSAVISTIYATQGGLQFLDVVDTYINNYGVVLAGLMEVVIVGWVLNNLKEFKDHANHLSDIHLGSWWDICLRYITPSVLTFMMIKSVMKDVTDPYGGYPAEFLAVYGWGVAAIVLVVGFIFSFKKWDTQSVESYNKEVS
jgi:NSS family neurotransmitter:Na+ symporter